MEIIQNSNINSQQKLVLTIGMFDGVHKAHRLLLEDIKNYAQKRNLKSALLTFNPHPRIYFGSKDNFKLLTTLEEKIQKLEKINPDYILVQSFDEEFRNLSAEEFVKEILIDAYHLHTLIIGYDHQFGKDRQGDFNQLKVLSEKYGFNLKQINEIQTSGITISSTKIRNALLDGNIALANKMLEENYSLSGKVIKGSKIGRKLGFPTANIDVDENKLVPKNGVYAVKVYIDSKPHYGMMNIGNRPTVSGGNIQIEVHIFDFDAHIYNKTIKVEFTKFIRDEQSFPSTKELIEQIKKDEIQIRKLFGAK
ncbi:MAG: bifunctional riboflavin kinase/FAD synthetase [Flavobacteriales bacterium]|nr:bifunctional riboflavin kinase/FAD synthetase [Flavobacteriales bacterium]